MFSSHFCFLEVVKVTIHSGVLVLYFLDHKTENMKMNALFNLFVFLFSMHEMVQFQKKLKPNAHPPFGFLKTSHSQTFISAVDKTWCHAVCVLKVMNNHFRQVHVVNRGDNAFYSMYVRR